MEYFRQLVTSAIQHQASHLYCVADQSPVLQRLNRIEFLQVRKSDQKEIESMAKSILSGEEYTKLETTGKVDIEMEFDGEHFLRVSVLKDTFDIKIIALIKHLALPTEGNLPNKLLQIVTCASQGILLLGGASHHNKDATVNFLLNKINTTQKKHILIFTDAGVFKQKSSSSIISSYSISRASFDFIKDQAADIVVFDNIRDNLISVIHNCVMLGMFVILSVDAVSTACTIERVLSLFPDRKSGICFLSSYMLGIVFQVFMTKKGTPGPYLYDFRECDDKIRHALVNGEIGEIQNLGMIEQINKLVEEEELFSYYDVQPILANLSKSSWACEEDADAF